MNYDYRIRKLKQEIKRLEFMMNYEARTEIEKYTIKYYIDKLNREIEITKQHKRNN